MWLFEGLQINRAWYPVTLRPMLSHVSSAKLRFPTYHLPLVCSTVVRTRTLVHFTSPNTISGAGKLQVKKKIRKRRTFSETSFVSTTLDWPLDCKQVWEFLSCKKKSSYPASSEAAAIERATQLNTVHRLPQYRHHSGMSTDMFSL